MKLSLIKSLAKSQVDLAIQQSLCNIETAISKHPLGVEIYVPALIRPHLEQYCDEHLIPFYHVAETCCSVAETYPYLYDFERKR